MTQGPIYRKLTANDVAFFLFLLGLCLAGSIGIFWFAVGVESGNRIIESFMRSLLAHAPAIVGILLLFNLFLVFYYSKKR